MDLCAALSQPCVLSRLYHFLYFSQDEQSALTMVKKHQILEQALEDYAQTIHQLANSSRLMVNSEHPERLEHKLFLILKSLV